MKNEWLLHIQSVGSESNPPLLLIHGFMEDMEMWTSYLPLLSENHFVLMIDLPGHGKSKLDSSQIPSISSIANLVIETIEPFALQNSEIIGHSLGGYVGLELMKQDSRFSHLTLLHSHPWADSDEKKKDRDRVAQFVETKSELFIQEAIPHLFAHSNQHETAIQRYIECAKKMTPSAISWSTIAMRDRSDLECLILENPEKFTLIQGEHDVLIPNERTGSFAALNNIEYIEIQDCGHMSHEEKPVELKAVFRKLYSNKLNVNRIKTIT